MASVGDALYGGTDVMIQAMFGNMARRGTGWAYIQNQGPDTVSFVGSCRDDSDMPHPFRYGSRREHLFVVGEFILRPALIVATDTLRGTGLGGLATAGHDLTGMLADGEILHASNTARHLIGGADGPR